MVTTAHARNSTATKPGLRCFPRMLQPVPMERRTAPSRPGVVAAIALMAAFAPPAAAQGTPAPANTAAPAPATPAPDAVGTNTPAAATANHPFAIIPNRNAFRIQPPPPPPPAIEEAPKPPPPLPSNVTLTGFTVWKGKKQVYLQVASAAGKSADYLTLGEDEAQGDIHVLEINPKAETVKLSNAGQEMTLNFKENGAKATGAGPGAPGVPNSIPSPVASAIAANNARLLQGAGPAGGGGPTIIGRGGVMDAGNAAVIAPNPTSANFPNNGGIAVPISSPAFNSTLPGFNSGVPNNSAGIAPNNSVTVGGQAIESTTAVPMVPGQDRIINGRRIPAPPPLPLPPQPVPIPGN